MDKSFMMFIAIGIGFLYFVTNFVGELQEDDSLQNSEYTEKHKYDAYQSADSIGREILDMTGASASVQVAAWNKSKLKDEFLMLFPDFSEMKIFAQERVRGTVLQEKISQSIDNVENEYFSGTLNTEGAKRALGTLK
ncbi:MAG: hypothetical protein DRG09_00250 [Epsilonproteobacteria bacterium]|nr:MAG: hypothetical protein DRG09_00250 [Campylobacterota bacterium]